MLSQIMWWKFLIYELHHTSQITICVSVWPCFARYLCFSCAWRQLLMTLVACLGTLSCCKMKWGRITSLMVLHDGWESKHGPEPFVSFWLFSSPEWRLVAMLLYSQSSPRRCTFLHIFHVCCKSLSCHSKGDNNNFSNDSVLFDVPMNRSWQPLKWNACNAIKYTCTSSVKTSWNVCRIYN